MKNKIVLTGGGTMGHISPNLALIPILTNIFDEIHYIGGINSLESEKVTELKQKYSNLYFHPITSTKLDRVHIFKNFCIPFKLARANKEANNLIKDISPKVLFSKGGYVSVPVVFAGNKNHIPIVIHESDLTMGLANKIASRYAKTICTTFESTAKKFKNGVWTGSPASTKLLLADPTEAILKCKLKSNLKTICITGGSLGSTPINNAIEKILPHLVKNYNIIHITGKGKSVNFKHPNYHQLEFADNIGAIFKASDLVISRAGSNTIFELALLKKPMLLIPLSKKASRGDQIDNANYFKSLGIAEVLPEEKLCTLEQTLDATLKNLNKFQHNLVKVNFSNGLTPLLNEIMKACTLD